MDFESINHPTHNYNNDEKGIPSDTFETDRGNNASDYLSNTTPNEKKLIEISSNDLIDIERKYLKTDVTSNVKTGVTELTSKKYTELLEAVTSQHWTNFEIELKDVLPAPFKTNGELPPVLNELYLAEKDKLTISFDRNKEKIVDHTKNNIERAITNALAQRNIYQKIREIYSSELTSSEIVPKTSLFEMRQEQSKLISDFIQRRKEFVTDAFNKFNMMNLQDLEIQLDQTRTEIVDGSIVNVQNRVDVPIEIIKNTLVEATKPSMVPIKEQMKLKLYSLESNNDTDTRSAVQDFSIKLKRASRESNMSKYQIDVHPYDNQNHDSKQSTPTKIESNLDYKAPTTYKNPYTNPVQNNVTEDDIIPSEIKNTYQSPKTQNEDFKLQELNHVTTETNEITSNNFKLPELGPLPIETSKTENNDFKLPELEPLPIETSKTENNDFKLPELEPLPIETSKTENNDFKLPELEPLPVETSKTENNDFKLPELEPLPVETSKTENNDFKLPELEPLPVETKETKSDPFDFDFDLGLGDLGTSTVNTELEDPIKNLDPLDKPIIKAETPTKKVDDLGSLFDSTNLNFD